MAWIPAGKFIRDVDLIRVMQKIEKGGGDVTLPKQFEFAWGQFVLSVSRTRGMLMQVEGLSLEERERLIADYGAKVADAIDVFVDKATREFSFTIGLYLLPDDERPSFAGNVGAAVADLVMRGLGFIWCANAGELKLRALNDDPVDKASKKTPDYVYDPGELPGFEKGSVVIVEAKGSLSADKARPAPLSRRAREAYKRQVRDFIGTTSQGLLVANGYAIAFGSIPGEQKSRIAIATPQTVLVGPTRERQLVSLSAAATGSGRLMQPAHAQQKRREQVVPQPQHVHIQAPVVQSRRGGGGGHDGGEGRREGERAQPSGRIAYANYENVFLLFGARKAAAFLRRILSGDFEDPADKDMLFQEFWRMDTPVPILFAGHYGPFGLGIYEPSARAILKSAAGNRLSPPPTVELPIAPVIVPREELGGPIAMQGDGFVLFDWRGAAHHMTWDLVKGDWA